MKSEKSGAGAAGTSGAPMAIAAVWLEGAARFDVVIVTEANKKEKSSSAAAVALQGDKLWVLAATGVHAVDPATGDVAQVLKLEERRASALAFDGKHFVTGSSEAIQFVDPKTGKTVRSVPTNYPVRALACHGGRLYVMEQPICGFDRKHQRIQVWPQKTLIHAVELPAAGAAEKPAGEAKGTGNG